MKIIKSIKMDELVDDNNLVKSAHSQICSCVLKVFPKKGCCLVFEAESSISLNQKPEEALKVHLSFSKPNFMRSFQLQLTFDNNLHDISQNYIYEVRVNFFIRTGLHDYHVNCFTMSEVRVSKTMAYYAPKLHVNKLLPYCLETLEIGDNSIIHLCCDIHRFEKLARFKNTHESNYDDVGTMLLKNPTYSDVFLVVGDTSFAAHKFILSKRSAVFKALFARDMPAQSTIVKIDEFDPNVIDEMLTYIYTGESKNISQMTIDLFKVAHKYELHQLKDICEEYLLFNVNVKNVVDLLELSKLHSLEDMEKYARKFINIHIEEMVKENRFLKHLSDDLIVDLVPYTLKLCTKYHLADLQLNVYEFIKDNKHIRDNQEFLDLFITHPLLMQDLFKYMLL